MSKRQHLGHLEDTVEVPDLIAVQLDSWKDFLQEEIPANKREHKGLQEAFLEVLPIRSFDENCILSFVSYDLGSPKQAIIDCLKDGETYQAPLHINFRLEIKGEGRKPVVLDERVYLGDLPIMTPKATFVVNGAERVIISQLHRTPGICFEKSRSTAGRTLYSYRIIPDRGSWLEVQYDNNDLMYIYLDRRRRRRKFLISTFFRATDFETNREMLDAVYGIQAVSLKSLLQEPEKLAYKVPVEDILDDEGTVLAKGLEPLTQPVAEALNKAGKKKIDIVDTSVIGSTFIQALEKDPTVNREDALKHIYKKMRPGDPPNLKNAEELLRRLFFDVKSYDLGTVGRYKINQRLGTKLEADKRTLQVDDLVAATRKLMELRGGKGRTDDIDHLGSRRVRTVGELVQNQFRVGLARTERLIRERMTLIDKESGTLTPGKLVNPKALQSVIRDFFGRSQLSQFMDQINPLSELTAKRRLSALGPGGLSRERAGFEVRDVHSSHYGRICPIETPEGPNIGLISSLAIYAKVNKYGFIETPYRKVTDGKVADKADYVTADVEEEFVIAQANAALDGKKNLSGDFVLSRNRGESFEAEKATITHMDVSPKQLVSPATSCIPFLEHDDANRALMGSNMQRQAVPLLIADSPYVGTGMEAVIARGSRAVTVALEDGVVASSTSFRIIVTKNGQLSKDATAALELYDAAIHAEARGREKMGKDRQKASEQLIALGCGVYELHKFMRSNANTCVNSKPIVKAGDKVKKGDILADGFSTEKGELALGRNILVAFMPWNGYNFEDAIIISERIVKEDIFTSIHINEANIQARDTKLGPEEITRDTPNVGEEALRNLGPEGVIRLGAEVKPGDILVGKITPKSETELAPEERLLRAIFGDKAADVKDSSLYVPQGVNGIVSDIRIERKVDPSKATLSKADIKRQRKELETQWKTAITEFQDDLSEKLGTILLGSKLPCDVIARSDESVIIPANRKITKVLLRKLAGHHEDFTMPDGPHKNQIEEVMRSYAGRLKDINLRHQEQIEQLDNAEGQEQGVIKQVKVYIAAKRKLDVGDKMAGRHGNKGIVSIIVPEADMPFQKDGQCVDMILNPLGVPSRMNVGQILETHLGLAAVKLGIKFASPVFDGCHESKIHDYLRQAGLPEDGKTVLYDGRNGEAFAQRVTVGIMYMIKLDHLVVNKIHARAVGPYSLVTQQPLGGKAQHGGQRFGEMEVWALEAYGAAYTLQEMLTVKSDDVEGRTRIYESIVRGDNTLVAGVPESFNVLMKEMQALCLDVRVKRD